MTKQKIDRVFATNDNTEHDFVFNDKVAAVFDNMVSRSVPMYTQVQAMMVDLAKLYLQDNTSAYDIGCSTGTTTLLLAQNTDKNITFRGIDASEEMIREAEAKLSRFMPGEQRIQFEVGTVTGETVFETQSVCISSLVLQFIRPTKRLHIVENIHRSLADNGAFLLFEKTLLPHDEVMNRQFIELYHKHKKDQGYSDGEINRKRLALENVLIPYSSAENLHMLRQAGFKRVEQFFQFYNFSAYIAIK